MKNVQREPLAGLVLFVVLGILLGLCLGFYLGYRYEQNILSRLGGNPVVIDVSDGYGWFLLVGTTIGGFVGLAIGIARYVVIKRTDSESHLGLDLRSK